MVEVQCSRLSALGFAVCYQAGPRSRTTQRCNFACLSGCRLAVFGLIIMRSLESIELATRSGQYARLPFC